MDGPPESCCMILISLGTINAHSITIPFDLLETDGLEVFDADGFSRLHIDSLKHFAILASSHFLHDLVSFGRSACMKLLAKRAYCHLMSTLS